MLEGNWLLSSFGCVPCLETTLTVFDLVICADFPRALEGLRLSDVVVVFIAGELDFLICAALVAGFLLASEGLLALETAVALLEKALHAGDSDFDACAALVAETFLCAFAGVCAPDGIEDGIVEPSPSAVDIWWARASTASMIRSLQSGTRTHAARTIECNSWDTLYKNNGKKKLLTVIVANKRTKI